MLTSLFRVTETGSRWLARLGILFLVLAMAVTVTDIGLRLVARVSLALFDTPLNLIIPGVVDITQLLIMAVAYLAMPYAFTTESHVAVELLTDRFGRRGKALASAFGALMGLGLMLLIAIYGLAQARLQFGYGDSSQTIGIPILWYWVPLLVGAALSVVATALLALRHLVEAMGGRP